jgi:hypothetical protein
MKRRNYFNEALLKPISNRESVDFIFYINLDPQTAKTLKLSRHPQLLQEEENRVTQVKERGNPEYLK